MPALRALRWPADPAPSAGLTAEARAVAAAVDPRLPAAEWLGASLEGCLAAQPGARRQTGSYFTTRAGAATLIEGALHAHAARRGEPPAGAPLSVLDPAAGTGVLLAEVWRRCPAERRPRLFAIDRSPLALATLQAALVLDADLDDAAALALGRRVLAADALAPLAPPAADAWPATFDLVVGNPPWAAYAGRAAQPLPPERRAWLRERFTAFRGYPTLHGVFVERAAELAPHGTVALIVPSSLSDLQGYAATRAALTRTHRVVEPLLELGEDAFDGVVQPSFALIACADPAARGASSGWRLRERATARDPARAVTAPAWVEGTRALPRFPPELFGELGFQSNPAVAPLLARAPPPADHIPLRQGRDVAACRLGPPRLWLRLDRELLRAARVRLPPPERYRAVAFVVRQTAAFPIAALAGDGLPFRNSLLAGFEHPELPAALVVGLLDSAPWRALHLAAQRDGRQGAFPQLKVAHLRALPAPLPDAAGRKRVAALVVDATAAGGIAPEAQRELDLAAGGLLGLGADEVEAARAWLAGFARRA